MVTCCIGPRKLVIRQTWSSAVGTGICLKRDRQSLLACNKSKNGSPVGRILEVMLPDGRVLLAMGPQSLKSTPSPEAWLR